MFTDALFTNYEQRPVLDVMPGRLHFWSLWPLFLKQSGGHQEAGQRSLDPAQAIENDFARLTTNSKTLRSCPV